MVLLGDAFQAGWPGNRSKLLVVLLGDVFHAGCPGRGWRLLVVVVELVGWGGV